MSTACPSKHARTMRAAGLHHLKGQMPAHRLLSQYHDNAQGFPLILNSIGYAI